MEIVLLGVAAVIVGGIVLAVLVARSRRRQQGFVGWLGDDAGNREEYKVVFVPVTSADLDASWHEVDAVPADHLAESLMLGQSTGVPLGRNPTGAIIGAMSHVHEWQQAGDQDPVQSEACEVSDTQSDQSDDQNCDPPAGDTSSYDSSADTSSNY